MTREEEIRQEAAAYILEMYGEENEDSDVSEGFREGAKWADKTMIDKACEWLDNIDTDKYMDSGTFQMSDLINDFKKAMEL